MLNSFCPLNVTMYTFLIDYICVKHFLFFLWPSLTHWLCISYRWAKRLPGKMRCLNFRLRWPIHRQLACSYLYKPFVMDNRRGSCYVSDLFCFVFSLSSGPSDCFFRLQHLLPVQLWGVWVPLLWVPLQWRGVARGRAAPPTTCPICPVSLWGWAQQPVSVLTEKQHLIILNLHTTRVSIRAAALEKNSLWWLMVAQ